MVKAKSTIVIAKSCIVIKRYTAYNDMNGFPPPLSAPSSLRTQWRCQNIVIAKSIIGIAKSCIAIKNYYAYSDKN